MLWEQVDPERRLRCLTLGTYAQAIVERLADPPGKRDKNLGKLIADTVSALDAIKEKSWPTASSSGLRPYGYVDQVTILETHLEHFKKPTQKKVLSQVLNMLRDAPQTKDEKTVEAAQDFFRGLALEALRQSACSIDEAFECLRA
jgi:hypothetical protein